MPLKVNPPSSVDIAGYRVGAPNGGLSNPFKEGQHVPFNDPGVNRFTKTNMAFETNPLIAFQDPTRLGFKLMFLFDQPDSGLLSTVPHPNTALGYLERLGYTERAYYLKQFVNLLRDVNSQCPWFWQTVAGLDEAWKRGYHIDTKFKSRLGSESRITIDCLESVDLRMTAMMDLYRKACFDWRYFREIVPWNLRTFSVYIYVYEQRTFNRPMVQRSSDGRLGISSAKMLGPVEDTGGDPAYINKWTNRMMFRFGQCELMPDESADVLSRVSNSRSEIATQKFAFSYRQVQEENVYNLYSDKYVTDAMVQLLDVAALDEQLGPVPVPAQDAAKTFMDKIGDIFDKDKLAQQAVDQLTSRARGLLSSAVGRVLLGNVYGFSPQAVATALQTGVPGALQQGLRTAAGPGASINNDEGSSSPGSYYQGVTPNEEGMATGNVMEASLGGESDGQPGTSLVNFTDSDAIGNIADGPSLQNTEETASGIVGPGSASLLNAEGDGGGQAGQGGQSMLNIEGSDGGQAGQFGQSLQNDEGVPQGQGGQGGPSLQNADGVANGNVADGPSLQNDNGLRPVRNVNESQQASRNNVSTRPNEERMGERSTSRTNEGTEPPGGQAGQGGGSLANDDSSEKPRGTIVPGSQSLNNFDPDEEPRPRNIFDRSPDEE